MNLLSSSARSAVGGAGGNSPHLGPRRTRSGSLDLGRTRQQTFGAAMMTSATTASISTTRCSADVVLARHAENGATNAADEDDPVAILASRGLASAGMGSPRVIRRRMSQPSSPSAGARSPVLPHSPLAKSVRKTTVQNTPRRESQKERQNDESSQAERETLRLLSENAKVLVDMAANLRESKLGDNVELMTRFRCNADLLLRSTTGMVVSMRDPSAQSLVLPPFFFKPSDGNDLMLPLSSPYSFSSHEHHHQSASATMSEISITTPAASDADRFAIYIPTSFI